MRTRPERRTSQWRTAAGALALTATVLLGTTACGADDDPGPTADDTTTTAKPTTTSPTSTTVKPEQLPDGHFIDLKLPDDLTAEEKEVAEAYRDALEAFARALRNPAGSRPDLSRYYTPTLLPQSEQRLEDFAAQGQAVRLPDKGKISIEVIDINITPSAAGLLVCLTDDSESYDIKSGERTKGGAEPHQVVVKMVRQDGDWQVDESPSRKTPEGNDRPCDA